MTSEGLSAERGEERPGPPVEGKGKGVQVSGAALASGIGIAALVTFMVQNRDDVRVDFLVWHFTLSVWLLVLVSALVGAVVWLGFGVLRRHRRRSDRRDDRRD